MRRALRETWLIDGYNILGAMDADRQTLHSLAHARDKLADALADFAGLTQVHCILVFDAHHVPQGTGSESDVSGVQVVYTKADETADQYIERECALRARRGEVVRVCTGDNLEQHIALGAGGLRMSARELLEALRQAQAERRRVQEKLHGRAYLFHRLDAHTLSRLEALRTAQTETAVAREEGEDG